MNIIEALAEYMVSVGYGTALNTDVFIGGAPAEPSTLYWLTGGGGGVLGKNVSGEKTKTYQVQIFYRNTDAEAVYNNLQALEIELNKSNCAQLQGFDTIEIEATIFPTDQDLDLEERTVGTVQVSIKTYYKE